MPDSRPARKLQATFWPAVALLALTLAVSELTSLDLWVQDFFFDFEQRRWLVDQAAPVPWLLFYQGPKVVLILFGLSVLTLIAGPERWRRTFRLQQHRRELAAVFATLALGPVLIGIGKAKTNLFCPYEIQRYGGDVPYVRVLESFPDGQMPTRRGRCFPAGHASGGFALLAVAGLARTRRGQRFGFAIGLSFGLWMGLYQMLKGAHYLSHTLVTALLVWMVFLGSRTCIQILWPADPPEPSGPGK